MKILEDDEHTTEKLKTLVAPELINLRLIIENNKVEIENKKAELESKDAEIAKLKQELLKYTKQADNS